ncbi:uncharacterized protein LOC100383560 [Zea mays]|uniref:DUF7725 domain-containing protein n=5 Tax=Zea mays TaxID=4577 RepID=C0PH29_MAIZE|nr:uncharacterized protein LOC100383560 [Zea mays]ACN34495.1 unknown [Zea mays]AQK57833.1 hypothetical protein ZEAMMB73_Zm00001d052723 [Zea mays]AQK57836.1 hypothetical protein ZEAMMB73_Zm00001d052723 [Zea mays]AQK57837.1 hypothetical protein ZEAMMB73_Zm00001d052723 [Zea mays]AQK57838.1 hypothetical protein ZEAMMB73_Zm00001d052723 [Zea mays]|eukprot:NP_001169679.1 uncharacterized protein LOC100383560 [Zea mays]
MEPAGARKEWRAVPDSSLRSNGAEDAAEHGKLGQSEERAIYEEGAGGLGDFCTITIDGSGGLSEDILQQRLQSVARQREELQQVEIELRAQAIAHPQIIEAQQSFQAAAKEHAAAVAKIKEQLHEREQYILELEMKLNDKDRELNALKIDHQTVWANQDLLREQTKELASVRRERDNSEAERAQHLKQIHDLQELLREKESQFIAIEEQHRAAQENILYKDEQLREAHAWVSQVREMDALQSQSLQVELRERMEQFNQYWISSQQQYAEMQRSLLHTIQQLQQELAEARERSGAQKDGPHVSREGSAESSLVQSIANSVTSNGSATADGSQQLLKNNGSVDVSLKGNNASAVPVPSLLGIGGPAAHIAAMHSFMIHPQGIPQPLASPNSGIPQFGSFQTQPMIQPNSHWPNQQEVQIVSQPQDETNYQTSQSGQTALQQDTINTDELSPKASEGGHPDHLNAQGKQQQSPASAPTESTHELTVVETNIAEHVPYDEQQKTLKEQDSLSNIKSHVGRVEPQEQNAESKVERAASDKQSEPQSRQHKPSNFPPTTQLNLKNSATENPNVVNQVDTMKSVTGGFGSQLPRVPKEPALLDERSLLACIVRAVPAGPEGGIRISSTLPNRLGKMLAPLHWHDYKKQYGKLDDFVASRPELFVIEGDFIHLREGAQQIISATTAAAKIAAATASSAPYSSLLPSVAVTPVAQSTRQKRGPAVDSRSSNAILSGNGFTDQFNIIQGVSDVPVSGKVRNTLDNGFLGEVRTGQPSVLTAAANGARHDKGTNNVIQGYGGKQQGRSTGMAYLSRR